MGKTCSAFGHRELYGNIDDTINNAVKLATEQGYTEFLTDNMSNLEKAVILMDEEWVNSLKEMEDYEPSEQHKRIMKERFGIEL